MVDGCVEERGGGVQKRPINRQRRGNGVNEQGGIENLKIIVFERAWAKRLIYGGRDHQNLIGLHVCTAVYTTANDSPHSAHSVSFFLINRSYTKAHWSALIDDISLSQTKREKLK
jgi:hypothetical protein